jgi:tripartite-type tricarboxylate transporter receptor subunit TctC
VSIVRLIALVVGGALAAAAHAQPYPWKPVKVVVPHAAGSTTDLVARAWGERLQASLGQPVVIENRPGAGGTIGAALVASATPDGHTLMVQSSEHTVSPHIYASLGYDTLKDFVPVTPLATLPNVLIVPPAKGYATLGDLVAAAKAKPGALRYASAGVGSATHLNAEKFRAAAKIDAAHVPLRGAAEAVGEVAAAHVDWFFAPLAFAAPSIRDGKVVALAVGTPARTATLPELRTTSEAGVPGAEYAYWIGVFAPARTPRDIVSRVQDESAKAMAAPEVRERLAALGAEAWTLEPAAFEAYVGQEIKSNASIVGAAGIKAN